MEDDNLFEFGLAPEDLKWQDLGLCNDMPTNMFFDYYETSDQLAATIDQMCLSCPVMVECLDMGTQTSSWGVWGATFLTSGKPDLKRNAHKTKEVWDAIKERLQR